MGGATNSVRSNQPDRLLVVEEHGTDHEAEGHQPVSPGTGSPGRLAISVPGWPPCCHEQSSTIATSSSHRAYIRPSEARGPCSPLDHPAAAVSYSPRGVPLVSIPNLPLFVRRFLQPRSDLRRAKSAS